jgi:hypothetical protein
VSFAGSVKIRFCINAGICPSAEQLSWEKSLNRKFAHQGCRGDNGMGSSGQFRTGVPFRTLACSGRPRAEQQANRKDLRCGELVDETAINRARMDRVQPELPPTFRGRRDELRFSEPKLGFGHPGEVARNGCGAGRWLRSSAPARRNTERPATRSRVPAMRNCSREAKQGSAARYFRSSTA